MLIYVGIYFLFVLLFAYCGVHFSNVNHFLQLYNTWCSSTCLPQGCSCVLSSPTGKGVKGGSKICASVTPFSFIFIILHCNNNVNNNETKFKLF